MLCGIIFLLFISAFTFQKNYAAVYKDHPILLLATSSEYGTYTGEILKTEGFNEFQLDSLSGPKISLPYLNRFDVVILAETSVTKRQKEMFASYVKAGGNFIAFKPDKELSEIFRIIDAKGTIEEGYIAIDITTEQGEGLITETMQFHGVADKYTLGGGKTIATLFTNSTSTTNLPAVVANNYGRGHAVAFMYNLPKSVVYTRQGNPAFAGIEKDGINGLRGMDLFTDGWLNSSKSTLNQADEQMRLLSRCIEKMSSYTKPLPRFWYFPDTLKCLVTLTNDGEFKGEADFEPQFHDVDSMGAKMTIYILEVNKVSKNWVDKWTAKGHEIAGHPDDTHEAAKPTWNSMKNALNIKKNEIDDSYGLPVRTNVNHWFVWCGNDANGKQNFGAEAQMEANHGIEMDVNYAHYDMNSNRGHFLGELGTNQGNFTGSGLVMKYADVNGSTINVYQHLNNVYDQQYNEIKDPEGFYNCFKGLVDRSLFNEVYSYISIKAHNDEYYFSKEPLLKMLAYANENGIPVWTTVKLLDFIKMKDEASFNNINWTNNQLLFKISSSLKHSNGLTFIIPTSYWNKKMKAVYKDGTRQSFIIRSVKGCDYAFVTVEPGYVYDIKVDYAN